MKAWQLEGFTLNQLVCNEIPQPTPGDGEVLVRISAVSLNYRDKLLLDGLYNPDLAFPMTQVADAVGEVMAIGPKTTRFSAGERVLTNYCTRWIDGRPNYSESTHSLGNTIPGALAEYLVLPEKALVSVPSYLTDEEAAAIPCAALTAWYSLVEKGGLKAGDTVLVQGTGGVSLFALQIAKALGAEVFVTSSSDEKLDRVKKMGASHLINYSRTPEWHKEVLAATADQGVDHIIEVVGGPNIEKSLTALRAGGQISIIGILDGFSSELPLFAAIQKQAVLRGISVGPRRALEDLLRAFAQLEVHPIIDSVYEFNDVHSAYKQLESGPFGKVAIRVGIQ
ncbi:NADPH:quinone reductase-like Zn-dependent oxidoreductase [Granulicella aggregans]|uniref:NADPH:quinone reductase-like Zn-dependent oxidoreductase n=1 Tax=Granulicella aggregans TaxID=474949 RepID=A0A7W8E6B2_9BACT|nr:NAD(P)-dependent alcohol dehydrogenase [Granulicella aggregans]MBB5060154.1 NADPH:quinone reductase-like Zn-dependent oxidoreductase [Granulicella aggregans]